MLTGNVLYEGTQNIYQSFLSLGCQKLCIQITGRTGAASTASCHYIKVGNFFDTVRGIVTHTWYKSHKTLKTLIDNREDPATIFAFSGSLASILNGNDTMTYNPEILTMKREARLTVLDQINVATSDYLGPHSLSEARQLVSVMLSIVRYPNEFLDNPVRNLAY